LPDILRVLQAGEEGRRGQRRIQGCAFGSREKERNWFSRHHIIQYTLVSKINCQTAVYYDNQIKSATFLLVGPVKSTSIIYSQQTKLSFNHHGWFVFLYGGHPVANYDR